MAAWGRHARPRRMDGSSTRRYTSRRCSECLSVSVAVFGRRQVAVRYRRARAFSSSHVTGAERWEGRRRYAFFCLCGIRVVSAQRPAPRCLPREVPYARKPAGRRVDPPQPWLQGTRCAAAAATAARCWRRCTRRGNMSSLMARYG